MYPNRGRERERRRGRERERERFAFLWSYWEPSGLHATPVQGEAGRERNISKKIGTRELGTRPFGQGQGQGHGQGIFLTLSLTLIK